MFNTKKYEVPTLNYIKTETNVLNEELIRLHKQLELSYSGPTETTNRILDMIQKLHTNFEPIMFLSKESGIDPN